MSHALAPRTTLALLTSSVDVTWFVFHLLKPEHDFGLGKEDFLHGFLRVEESRSISSGDSIFL